jgi:hypothetical protein
VNDEVLAQLVTQFYLVAFSWVPFALGAWLLESGPSFVRSLQVGRSLRPAHAAA